MSQTQTRGKPRAKKSVKAKVTKQAEAPETPTPEVGDNRGIAVAQLRKLVERIENLNEEKKTLSSDIAVVYAEAKAGGFNVPVIRELVKLRAQDAAKRREKAEILEVYADAVGLDLI